jgi:D-galactose 1-dehydrogenase
MKLALIGIGKIARDQHVPAIAASPEWEVAATVSRAGSLPGVEAFTDMARMLEARPDVRVVSLCLPPVPRFAYAQAALRAGRHVMLEKPPGASLSECHALEGLARENRVSLYASWHSREAAMVRPARNWLTGKRVTRAHVTWREDVRHWHPGQDWVFEPGGMGVFDPGINALSILTRILPMPVHLEAASLDFPENRQTPIAARLRFSGAVTAEFDWLQSGRQTWEIAVETPEGRLLLDEGGARLWIDGSERGADDEEDTLQGEYPRLYDNFARLVKRGGIDMDLSPLTHVADAFMLGARRTVAPFDW